MAYTYVKPSTLHDPTPGGTAPTTWGDVLNAATNLLAPNSCVVRRVAVQSINTSSLTTISFDTEDLDDNGFYTAGSPTRITLPRKGIYLIEAAAVFASNATGYRYTDLPRSGGSTERTVFLTALNGVSTVVFSVFVTAERNVGDYYEYAAWQNSGGALDVTARISVTLLQDRT